MPNQPKKVKASTLSPVLSAAEEKFCQLYASTGSNSKAVKESGVTESKIPNVHNQVALRLLARPEIQERIKAIVQEQTHHLRLRVRVGKEELLDRALAIALCNQEHIDGAVDSDGSLKKDADPIAKEAISAIEVKNTRMGPEIKVKRWDRLAAMRLVLELQGELSQQIGNITFTYQKEEPGFDPAVDKLED